METDTRHTPTPKGKYQQSLAVCNSPEPGANILLVDDATGEHVAEVLDTDPRDCTETWARLLVTRYNAHDQLKTALWTSTEALAIERKSHWESCDPKRRAYCESLDGHINANRALLSQLEAK